MTRCAFLCLLLIVASVIPDSARAKEGEAKADPEVADRFKDLFKVVPDPSGKAYFPEGKAAYYTKHLAAMKEPSLQADLPEGATFVLRFTLLPSFADNLVVRIYDKEGKLHVRAVRQKKDKNYNPDKITEDRTLVLDKELSDQIKNLFSGKEFWKPLTEHEEGLAGLDGARWIFEKKDKTGYHLLDLWTPEIERASDEVLKRAELDPAQIRDYAPYVKAGRRMLKLVNFEEGTTPP